MTTNPLHLPAPELLLRAGLAISFLYPALHALTDPYAWVGYFPPFLLSLAGEHTILMLHVWGAIEVVLALWVLFARNVFIPSTIMAVALMAVVIANPAQFPILFRDVTIALAAGALAWMHRPKHGA